MSNLGLSRAQAYALVPDADKKLVNEGKLSIDEAIRRNTKAIEASQPKKSLDPTATPKEEYGAGVAMKTGATRAGQAVDAAQAAGALSVADAAEEARLARKESLLETFQRNLKDAETEKARPKSMTEKASDDATSSLLGPGLGYLADKFGPEIQAVVDTARQKATIPFSDKGLENVRDVASASANKNIEEILAAKKLLDSLPKDQYTPAMVDALNRGDWLEAAKNMPASTINQMVEEVPTLAVQAGIVGGTALATRNPQATAAAARVAGAAGGFTELGSDFEQVYSKLSDEDKKDPKKVKAAMDTAVRASSARALIEGSLPGVGNAISAGKPLAKTIATNLASQFAGDAGGEMAASNIKGDNASFGEIVAEGLGGVAGTAVESSVEIYQQSQEIKKLTAEFDKAQAELEGKTVEAKAVQSQTKELEKQVDAIAKGETPVIQDLFSGEAVPAEVVAAKQSAVEAGIVPAVPEAQQAKIDEAKTELVKKQEADKATDVEARVQEELAKQKEIKAAEDVLATKYELVSVPSIEKEARQRLAVEQQAIADRPFNRTPEGLAQLPKVLADHKAVRMFQLKEEVAKERLAQVESAQKVVDGVKEQEVRTKIEQQVAKEKAKAPEQTALPMKYEQQPQPNKRGYTGEPLTEQQKVAEVTELALKKEAASLPPEEAKVLLDEAAKAQKTFVAQEKKQEKAKASVYAKAESSARASILQEVVQSMPNSTPAERSVAAARKMVNWKRANPQKSFVSEDTGKVKTLTEKLQAKEKLKDDKTKKVKAGQEQKAAEKLYEGFKKEALDKGLPEKEARIEALDKLTKRLEETESDAALPKEADTTLRESLRSKSKPVTPALPKALSKYNKDLREQVAQNTPGYAAVIEDGLANGHEGLIDVLDYIANTDTFGRGYPALAKRLLPIVKRLKIDFKDSSTAENPKAAEWRGHYDANTDTVYIGDHTPETVLHEVIHAIIWHVIEGVGPFKNNASAKALVSKLRGLQFQVNTHINKNFDKFTPTQKEFIEQARSVKEPGMLGDIHELLSYGFTSPIGQRILSKIPAFGKIATATNNALKSFIASIKSFMDIPEGAPASALDDVLTIGEDVIKFAEDNIDSILEARGEVLDNFKNYKAQPNQEVPSDKPRPVLKRTSKVVTVNILGKRREFRVLNHGEKGKILGVIKDALTAGHGSRVNVTEALERAGGLIGEHLQRAKAWFDTIENTLKDVAKKQGVPLSTVQDNFTEAVAKIEEATDDAKVSLSNSLVRNYGDAARAYFANRAEIDLLTGKIIQERLNDPTPFTEKEAAVYTKMKNELGKYYTRAYASNLKGVREEYARTILEAYKAKQEGKSTIAQDKLAKIMEAAVDTIEHAYVIIPDTDVLLESSLSKLRTLAATWDIKVAENDSMSVQDRKDALIEALESFRQDRQHMDPDFTAKRALALATELIKDVEGSAIVNYVKGERADRTVVEAREKIPAEIRKFLGEYNDVALKGLTTVLKQAQFVFQQRALGEILNSEQAKGEGSSILSVEEFTERGYDPADWKIATGESFGPLQGKRIEQALYNRLKEMQEVNTPITVALEQQNTGEVIRATIESLSKGWMGSMSVIKQGQLVLNPVNAAYNLSGGPSILLSNGAFGEKGLDNVGKAFATASKLIAAQGSASVVDSEVSRMIRLNQVDSAYLGALRGSEMDKVKDLLLSQLGEEASSKLGKAFEGGKRMTKEKLTWSREVYAMMDVVWKIAAFYHRVDTLTEFHRLNGDNVSAEDIDWAAASDNSTANFSYSRVPTMVKAIEKAGPSYILPFIYESFRAPLSSMLLGMSDIKAASKAKTPEARAYLTKEGAKRTLGAATSLSFASVAMHAGASFLASLFGDEEEEDQKLIERLRPFMADYEKHDKYFVMGRKKNGDAVLFNFSRTDPFDVPAKLARMLMDDADAEEYGDYFKGLFIKNRMGASILDAAGAFFEEDDGKRAKNTKMENWARPDFIPQDWPSVYESLSSFLGPKSVKAIDTILPSWPNRALDSRTEAFDIPSAMLKYGGGAPTTVDIAKNLEFAVMDYDKSKKAASELLKSKIQTNQMLKKEEYAKAWIKATEEEKEAFNKLAEKYQAIQSSLGYSKEEAAAYLKAAKLDEATVNSLLLGTYRPENSLLISKRSMKALSEDILKDKNPGTRARNARNYNAALEAIEAYNLPVKE